MARLGLGAGSPTGPTPPSLVRARETTGSTLSSETLVTRPAPRSSTSRTSSPRGSPLPSPAHPRALRIASRDVFQQEARLRVRQAARADGRGRESLQPERPPRPRPSDRGPPQGAGAPRPVAMVGGPRLGEPGDARNDYWRIQKPDRLAPPEHWIREADPRPLQRRPAGQWRLSVGKLHRCPLAI